MASARNSAPSATLLLLASCGLLGSAVTAANAQPLYHWIADPLTQSVPNARAGGLPAPEPQAVAHPVALDLDLLRSRPELLGLPLPDGEPTLWAVRTRLEDRGEGNLTWTGRENGTDYDSVLLSLRDGLLFGTFSSGGREYVIQESPTGPTVRRVVRGAFPADTKVCEVSTAPGRSDAASIPMPSQREASTDASTASPVVIDVLVLYTSKARRYLSYAYRSYTVDYMIEWANDLTNTAFANSQIPASTRLVGVKEMPESADPAYHGVTSFGNDTLWRQTSDAKIRKLREKYGADIVYAFIYDDSLACGLAWGRSLGQSEDYVSYFAHALTNLFCDDDVGWGTNKKWKFAFGTTMAHEIGHIHGAEHDAASNPPPMDKRMFPYAMGYVDTVNLKETVMGTAADYYKYTPAYYFSNVRVTPNGWTLGEVNVAENERVMQQMAATTSRLSDYVGPPDAPSNLRGQASNMGGGVLLWWQDNANNETSYVVKYRRAGKQWRTTPEDTYSLPANVTKANIHSLQPGERYVFRVRAVNEYGATASRKIWIRPK